MDGCLLTYARTLFARSFSAISARAAAASSPSSPASRLLLLLLDGACFFFFPADLPRWGVCSGGRGRSEEVRDRPPKDGEVRGICCEEGGGEAEGGWMLAWDGRLNEWNLISVFFIGWVDIKEEREREREL